MNNLPIHQLLDLTGKTAIITGGAAGIGYGITHRLAEAGANVIVANRKSEDASRAEYELANQGHHAKGVVCDVSKEQDVKQCIETAVNTFGCIDIIVNNAGIFPMQTIGSMTLNDFQKVISTNLQGVFLFTKYAAEQMIRQGKGGKIINITSIDAVHPSMIGLAHYDASKHGVWGFTKNAALEFAQHNIAINAVAPGGIVTPGVQKMQANAPVDPTVDPAKQTEAFLATLPFKRMGMPDEIGKVVLFLASDMASYITGSQIIVDGGALIT